jgi:hypothetical protein
MMINTFSLNMSKILDKSFFFLNLVFFHRVILQKNNHNLQLKLSWEKLSVIHIKI